MMNTPSRIVLHLDGLTADALGYGKFRRIFHSVRGAAERYAPGQYHMQAEYEDHQRIGYVLDLPNRAAADLVLAAYGAALAGQRMPWIASA